MRSCFMKSVRKKRKKVKEGFCARNIKVAVWHVTAGWCLRRTDTS